MIYNVFGKAMTQNNGRSQFGVVPNKILKKLGWKAGDLVYVYPLVYENHSLKEEAIKPSTLVVSKNKMSGFITDVKINEYFIDKEKKYKGTRLQIGLPREIFYKGKVNELNYQIDGGAIKITGEYE